MDDTAPRPPTDTFRPFAVVDRLCKSCGHIQPARQGMKCESCSEEWQWSVPVSTAPQSSSADKQKLADRVAAALRLREWDRAEIEQVRSMLSTPPSARREQQPVAWMFSNEEGDDDFGNNFQALKNRHYKGGPIVPLYAAIDERG